MQSLTPMRQHESIGSSFSRQQCRRERTAGMFGLARTVCIAFALCAAITVASQAQTFNTLLNFDGTDGGYPFYESLIQGTDGNYYGTTSGGGKYTAGTVFSITPVGAVTTLYSFCSQSNSEADCIDGESPYAGLVQATNGNFYGTTSFGGANGEGTVFELTPEPSGGCPSGGNTGNGWCETVLYSFCSQTNCTDGENPEAGLIQDTNGNLYGTTSNAGANGFGTVFEITLDGKLTTLNSFDDSDGAGPNSGVIQATNGALYGTANSGGLDLCCGSHGTVFQITTAGKLNLLHEFAGSPNDGSGPNGMVQAANGDFYGTTSGGGAHGNGTVFKMTAGGKVTILYSFCSETDCTDGENPDAGLVQATDGNFYGTTTGGGPNKCGEVFKITPAGKLTVLHGFDGTDGDDPRGGLMQATNGTFYGTTTEGANGSVTVFSLSVGLGPFIETIFTSGKVGTPVIILGNNLAGSSSVDFNGTAATYEIDSNTEITTTVPAGATTGTVTVTTLSGSTLDSNVIFRVTPQITSFSPTSAEVGAEVTITGVSLTQTSAVTFDGLKATTFTVNSDTQVTATVPVGAKPGKIGITTAGGAATSPGTFDVTPQITSFSPTSGPVGDLVTITGNSLTQTTSVSFGGVSTTDFTVNSDTQVNATVPTGAQSGNIVITTRGGTATSATSFTVTQ